MHVKTFSLDIFANLPFCTFWKAPAFSNSLRLIGTFPPSDGANEENCGGSELSKANPCRSLKLVSSNDEDDAALNCGGSCSDAVNCGSATVGGWTFDAEDKRDFPPRLPLLTGRRRITLPCFSAPPMEEMRRIPNATVCNDLL